MKHVFEPKLADEGFEFRSQTKCLSVNFECECLATGSYVEKRLHPKLHAESSGDGGRVTKISGQEARCCAVLCDRLSVSVAASNSDESVDHSPLETIFPRHFT